MDHGLFFLCISVCSSCVSPHNAGNMATAEKHSFFLFDYKISESGAQAMHCQRMWRDKEIHSGSFNYCHN